MREIQLTRGRIALVDDEDFDRLNIRKWYPSVKHHKKSPNEYYAVCRINGKQSLMHRVILNAPQGLQVDHIDGDGLNNQKANLRLVTQSQNGCNRDKARKNKTGYKGVFPSGNGFRARIGLDYKKVDVGSFNTAREAAIAYNNAALRIHGEYAYLNKID